MVASLIGSTAEEVEQRLGIAAETVERIVRNRIEDAKAKQIDPQRCAGLLLLPRLNSCAFGKHAAGMPYDTECLTESRVPSTALGRVAQTQLELRHHLVECQNTKTCVPIALSGPEDPAHVSGNPLVSQKV